MDIIEIKKKLSKLAEITSLLKEANNLDEYMFVLIKQNHIESKSVISVLDFKDLQYVILIGNTITTNGYYRNWNFNLLGFLDECLNFVEKINFYNGWTLTNITFVQDSCYQITRPVLHLQNLNGKDKQIVSKNSGDFKSVIKEALSL